jgi:hypothetical protein
MENIENNQHSSMLTADHGPEKELEKWSVELNASECRIGSRPGSSPHDVRQLD